MRTLVEFMSFVETLTEREQLPASRASLIKNLMLNLYQNTCIA